MIKAIFFDIDGTLIPFGDNPKLPDSTFKALQQLQEKGIKVFVATGRPYDLMTFIMDMYPFDGYLTFNGQYCFDNKGNTIYETLINPSSISSMIDYVETNHIGVMLCTKNKTYRNIYCTASDFQDFELLEDIHSLENTNILQIMAFIPIEQDKDFIMHYPGSKSVRWTKLFADIIPVEGGKHKGIDEILKHYNIQLEESMAFGDGGNDISMLEHCSIGVAMGNANDIVKQHADYVTTNVEKDGIYNALKHFHIL